MAKQVEVKSIFLDHAVMHLDTALFLLPNKYALACLGFLTTNDSIFLKNKFKLIPMTLKEQKLLETNVLILNPETVIIKKRQVRIQKELLNVGFNVETLDYLEPIALGALFAARHYLYPNTD